VHGVISPPLWRSMYMQDGVLTGEPNVEVLDIEIDVDYTRNDVETDVFDT
jgi:hypothetical protein